MNEKKGVCACVCVVRQQDGVMRGERDEIDGGLMMERRDGAIVQDEQNDKDKRLEKYRRGNSHSKEK